jgi:hypothetical protein
MPPSLMIDHSGCLRLDHSGCLRLDHSGCLGLRAAAQDFHPSRHSTLSSSGDSVRRICEGGSLLGTVFSGGHGEGRGEKGREEVGGGGGGRRAQICLRELRARSRSLIMSSAVSIPIDNLITSSPAPAAVRCSVVSCRWVVDAGCRISDRVSPMLTR